MKTCSFLIFLLLVLASSNAQPPGWTNFKQFAGQSFDYTSSVKVDKKDNYYIASSSQNPINPLVSEPLPPVICNFIQPVVNTLYNGLVLRYDSLYNLTLSIKIENCTLGEIAVDSAGDIFVSGVFQFGASRDGFIKKYTPNGNLLWTIQVQSGDGFRNADDVITSLDIDSTNTLVMCGFSQGANVSISGDTFTGPANFITKLNTAGRLIWYRNFSSDLGVGFSSVRFEAGGNILATGTRQAFNAPNLHPLIAKIDNLTGFIIWEREFLTQNNNLNGFGNAITSSGDTYLFGGTFGGKLKIGDTTYVASGSLDIFLLQCDTAGNIQWSKVAGSPGTDLLLSMVTDKKGITFFTGGFSDGFNIEGKLLSSKGYTDVYIAAINSTGKMNWILTGGSEIAGHTDDGFYKESGNSIDIDPKNQLQLVGVTRGSGNFGTLKYKAPDDIKLNGFWLTLGNTTSAYEVSYQCGNNTSAEDTIFNIKVNPNPFTNRATISNTKNIIIDYTVWLYNSLGQKLSAKNYFNTASINITEWSTLPSGLYFLKIKTASLTKTIKLLKK